MGTLCCEHVRLCVLDLLEKSKTTGQAARLLYDPPRREKLEREAAKAKLAQEQKLHKGSKKAGGRTTKTGDKSKVPEQNQTHGVDEEEEEEEEEEEMADVPAPVRHWYSLVCYGLPNLVVVTQSGKN